MNITQLMRGLIGETQQADAKTLELKVGQIVKGIVLQLLSEQEALVNIGGVQVRAKLETPLQRGQVTMLQVQPESTGGQIVLKPLQASSVPILEQSLSDLIRDFGLKDAPQQRQLLRQMHQEGMAITKENVSRFQSVLAMNSDGTNSAEWVQSALLADTKGLPLTKETIGSLHQVLHGPSFYEQLDELEAKITSFLASDGSKGHPFEQTAVKLESVLRQIRLITDSLGHGVEGSIEPDSLPSGENENVDPISENLQIMNRRHQEAEHGAVINGRLTQSGTFLENTNHNVNAGSQVSPMVKETDNLRKAELFPDRNERNSFLNIGQNGQQTGQSVQTERHASDYRSQEESKADQQLSSSQSSEKYENGKLIQRLLKWIGMDYESNLLTRLPAESTLVSKALHPGMNDALRMSEADVNAPNDDSAPNVTNTLKNALLQLQQSDDVPLPIKETAQQVLQHVTGQQLLAVSDRGALFTHMTLFIPLKNDQGNQTAAIQIQSRKGQRGELDSNNCRLLFDLHMGALGDTVVDVQVVNRIIALQVHNDHPLTAALLETQRGEIAAAVQAVGYQFLSLKAVPFPKKIDRGDSGSMDGTVDKKTLAASVYGGKAYKRMDLRI